MNLNVTVFRMMILICCMIAITAHAQKFEEENAKVMERIDTESFKGKVLLNKAITLDYQLEPFRNREKDRDGAYVMELDAMLLRHVILTAERGDMDNRKKPEALDRIFTRSRKEITSNNVIPIGIINMDAVLLTDAQVEENVKAKSEGKSADASRYETIELIAAGLLQDEVFQGDVAFQLSRNLLYGNNQNDIKSVSIDFLDGKGWQTYALKDELIRHQFEGTGEVAVYIRLETSHGKYITMNKLAIRMQERIKPDETGSVTAEGKEDGRLSGVVSGAEFAIYNGCDGILDKPIIIAEGFDTKDKNGIDDMMGRYHSYFSTFRNHAYDMVYVNYTDGQAAIQDNAQALKRVINEIKSRIRDADSIIYVGASMSGLIGRWALREMENAGQPHKVKLFIGLDAGQQGSYIPHGLVALRRSVGTLGGWKGLLLERLLPGLKAIETPASKQLLRFYNDIAPHQDFYALKQNLTNMGNGGYPALSRNIALVNGSLNGAKQKNRYGNILTPGEQMVNVNAVTLVGGAYVKVWSNVPGQNTKTFSAVSATVLSPFAFEVAYANIPVNYDRLPGGYVQRGVDFRKSYLFAGSVDISANPRFTHMPMFSSIDYRGPLSSDADHAFQVGGNNITNINNQVINPSLTPFKAIYGNENLNSEHTYAVDILNAINTLALRELGLNKDNRLASCPVLSSPPPVKKATLNSDGTWYYSSLQGGRCPFLVPGRPDGNVITLYAEGSSPDYEQFIEITGPNDYVQPLGLIQGRAEWSYEGLPSGSYNIKVIRQFAGTLGRTVSSVYFHVGYNCASFRTAASECPIDGEEGEPIALLTDTNEQCYAVKINGVWVAMLENGTFVSRERLMANGFTAQGANCYAATDPRGSAPASSCPGLGSITYQRWENIGGGTSVNDLINGTNGFQNASAVTQNVGIFEAPVDVADNSGTRIRGYICPPTTGLYTFWLAGDDNAQLWLSTDENPDNSELQALIDSWTPSREWSWYGTQRSYPVTLQAGQKYYIEARSKEGSGGDNLAVGWQLPNGALERPIPGNRLAPFGTTTPPPCDFNITAGNTNSNPSANQGLQLNYNCSGAECNGVSYTWSGNGISGNSSPLNITAPGSSGSYTYTVTASKSGCSNKTAITTINVGTTGDCNYTNGQVIGTSSGGTNVVVSIESGCKVARWQNANGNARVHPDWIAQLTGKTVPDNVLRTCVKWDGDPLDCQQNPCDFNVTAGNTNANPSANQSLQLSYNCSGAGCNGVSYAWSGNGASGSSSPLNINAPGSNDSYTYTVTASKSGCSNKTATTSITVGNSPQACDCGFDLISASQTSGQYTASFQFNSCSVYQIQWSILSGSTVVASGTENVTSSTIPFTTPGNVNSGSYTLKVDVINCSGTDTVPFSYTKPGTTGDCNYTNGQVIGTSSGGTNVVVSIESGCKVARWQNANGNGRVHPDWIPQLTGKTVPDNVLRTCVKWDGDPINCGGRMSAEPKTGPASLETENEALLFVSPNPSNGAFDVSFRLEKGQKATLLLLDAKGAALHQRQLTGTGDHKEHVTTDGVSSGSYLVVLRRATGQETKRVVLIK